MSQDYRDPIIQKYLDLIKDNTSGIKGFYNGLTGSIKVSMIPAVIISIESTEITEFSNLEDEHRIKLLLNFIADIRKDFNRTALISAGLNQVREKLVGRESDYKLKTSSIAYILRHNINIDEDNNLRTDVGSIQVTTPNEVSADRITGLWSAEGSIRFDSHFLQER